MQTWGVLAQNDAVYTAQEGRIDFISDAPLELIKAASDELKGALDMDKQTFAFSVPMISFQGFNSPLQREHFNERYVESSEFPDATFSGKIIEQVDFSQPGIYVVRAKGILDIHGVKQERIIKGSLEISEDNMKIQAAFTVPVKEHNIKIPRVVFQKIAELIKVTIEIDLQKQSD